MRVLCEELDELLERVALTTAAGGDLAAVIENVGTIETALIETEAT